MKSQALLLGPYGIDGVLTHIIEPLLDVLAVDHLSYQKLMIVLDVFSLQLAKKIRSWKKVCHCYAIFYSCNNFVPLSESWKAET